MDRGRYCAAQLMATGEGLPAVPYVTELHGPQWYSSYDVQNAFMRVAGKQVYIELVEKDDLADRLKEIYPPDIAGAIVDTEVAFLSGGIINDSLDQAQNLRKGTVELVDVVKNMYSFPWLWVLK